MADNDLVIASTTDTEASIKAALEPREDTTPALADVDRATGQPVEAKTEPPVEETPAGEEKPAEAAQVTGEEKKPAADAGKPAQKKSRSEERINELTREKYLAQRRADRLQSELDALKVPPQTQPPPQHHQQQVQPPPQAQAKKPAVTDYAVYEDFVDALTQWNARQIAAEQIAQLRAEDALAVVQAQQQEMLSVFEAAKTDARQRYPDFDDVMTSDVAVAMPITEPMQHIITTSPVGHDVAYYLVQHPDEAQVIAQQAPLDALRTLGRLEERVNHALHRAGNGRAAAQQSAQAHARVTSAPPPVEPVGGHATTTSLSDDQLDYQSYKTKRNREEAERRKARR